MPADPRLRILIVEDDEVDYRLARLALEEAGEYQVEWVQSYNAGLQAVCRERFDAVLLDYRLGAFTGLDFLKRAVELGCRVPIILLTGQSNRAVDVEAMRLGAADYLVKDEITPSLLERSLRYAVRQHEAEEALREAEERSRTLVNSIGAILWRGDPVTLQFYFVSREAEHLLGYPVEQWVGEPNFWERHLHPADRERAVGACRDAALRGAPHQLEYRMIAADGREVWLRDIVRVVNGELVGVMVDVTERRRVERVLQLRDRSLAAISEGILITDPNRPDNPITYVNPGFERITGYSAAEALGKNWSFLRGPDTDPAAVAHLATAVRERRAVVVELLSYRKDGTPFYNELSISPVYGEGSEVMHFVGVQKDVTERRRAAAELKHQLLVEHALSESSRLLATDDEANLSNSLSQVLRLLGEVAGASRAHLFLMDPGGRTVSCACEWSAPGVAARPADRQQLDLADFPWSTGRMHNGDVVALTDLVAVPEEAAREAAIWRAQGIRAVLFVPVRSPQGELLGSLGFDDTTGPRRWAERDVRALRTTSQMIGSRLVRTHVEAALRESEEHFRLMVEGSEQVFFYEHTPNSTITYLSPSFRNVFGYEPEEWIGRAYEGLLEDDPRNAELEARTAEALRTGQRTEPYTAVFRHRDGHRVILELVERPVVEAGVVTGIQGFARDITEREQAQESLRQREEQLRQAQKMEAVGRLAGGIAHDFNNLLTAIKGNTEIALMDVPADTALREDLEGVQRAADRAAALTRQLLAFSRRQVLQPAPVNLNQVVTELERMLRRLIGEDIEFCTELAPRLSLTHADPGQMEQVLMNLVVNARDAMPEGGRLVVETSNTVLTQAHTRHFSHPVQPGAYVRLTVSDSGAGMDQATQSHIFEPFFTTKELGKGTGLGLATVYGIVKQSGGYIWVNSAIGQGTTFEVYLPSLQGEHRPSAPAVDEVPLPHARATVLLVEDEDMVREVTLKILRRGGYDVLTASGPEDALRIAREYDAPIHLLLTDVVMPGMKGPELADRLRGMRPAVRVLYMSGYAEEAIASHGAVDVHGDFIEKPFPPHVLLGRVRGILDRPPVRE